MSESTGPSASVSTAIAHAARKTGVSPFYLQATALRESAFDPQARAATSSAAGLFQFIERTWLDTLQRHGAALGVEAGATPDGDDGAQSGPSATPQREDLLALRFDPHAAALMAGALTRDNADTLARALDRPAASGELYAAHVLGAGDAVRLIKTAAEQPETPAADLFPRAAAANERLFHNAEGAPLDAAGLLARLTGLIDSAKASAGAAPQAPGDGAPASGMGPAAFPTSASAQAGQAPLRLTPEVAALLATLEAPKRAESERVRDEDEPRHAPTRPHSA